MSPTLPRRHVATSPPLGLGGRVRAGADLLPEVALGGAYATGVLVLFTLAAFAVTLAARRARANAGSASASR